MGGAPVGGLLSPFFCSFLLLYLSFFEGLVGFPFEWLIVVVEGALVVAMVAVEVESRYDDAVDGALVIFCFPLGVGEVFVVCAVCAVVSVVLVVVVIVVVIFVVDMVVDVVVMAVVVVVGNFVVVVVVGNFVVVSVVVESVDIIGDSLKMVKVLGIFLNLTFSSSLARAVAFSSLTISFLLPTVSFFMLTLNQGCGLPERFGSFLLSGGFSILRLLSEAASLTCSEKVSFSLVPGI